MKPIPSAKVPRIEAKLARYSALAGTAVATVPAADAAVVHVTGMPVTVGQNSSAFWNIDGTGSPEFYFSQLFTRLTYTDTYQKCTSSSGISKCFTFITSSFYTINRLEFSGYSASFTTKGSSNEVVEPGAGVFSGYLTYLSQASSPLKIGEQILGFRFRGQNGVARLTLGPQTLEIIEWAYQTEAGVPIAKAEIPEPSSLALLAAGAVGLGAYRRRRETVTAGK